MLSREHLERQIRRFYGELWNRWRFEIANELLAPDIVFRGSLGAEVSGREGFVEYARMVRAAFPDFRNDVDELFVDEPKRAAAAQLRYSGTHEGMLFGLAPTGGTITYAGAALFRFDEEARIARAWVLGDLVSLFKQLGLDRLSRIPQS